MTAKSSVVRFAFGALCGALMLGMFAGAAAAQDKTPPPLSLKECLEIALKNQSDILSGNQSLLSSQDKKKEAESSYYPQISAQRTSTLNETGWQSVSRTVKQPGEKATLSIQQNLYDGGLREAGVGGAKASVTQTEATLARTTQTVVFDVTKDYISLLLAKSLLGVQQTSVKSREGQLELVKSRIEAGAAADVESLPVEAQLANAKVDLLSAVNSVNTAAIQLQNTMGLSPQLDFSVEDVAMPATELDTVDSYLKKAVQTRPELQGASAAMQKARYSVKTAKISLYPRPDLSAQYGQGLIGNGTSNVSVTGMFVYDIYTGGNNRAAYRDAQTGLAKAEISYAQLQKDINMQVQLAYLNAINSKERVAASEVSLQSAQKNLDVQNSRYKLGLAIPLDLLNAQLTVITAQSTAIKARYDYISALSQLDYAVGAQGGSYEK